MKHRIFTLMLLLLTNVFAVEANPVDMQAARDVAVKFMNANTKAPMRGIDDLQLVTTYSISRGDVAFYVFNTQNGFVIVSADDCATPILGYSEEGQFDMENIPIQMQGYLQDFVDQIQYGIENHIEADEQTARQWELVRAVGRLNNNRTNRTVEPLITAMWDQGCYYNEMCPEDVSGMCGHVYTGCVATAMAQIMHYWGYPDNGTGSYSYIPTGYPEQSVDFGATTYDWDNMPDQLDGASSYEQIDAVATLLWHCGVSVDMEYSPDGSGAYSSAVGWALANFFSYSYEYEYEYQFMYPDAIWKAKLKDCLNLGRPVYYDGSSSSTSHAFVCDGYDNNDMFHFNWGWSGAGNGYFAIGALNVTLYFMYYYEFNDNNGAIFNIHPQGETTNYVINVSVYNDEGGTVSGGGTFAHGDYVTLAAFANDGYGFCYWEENGEIASTDPNYSFNANYNRDLVAVFAEPFTVTASAEEGGTVSGGGSYYYGEYCLVTAIADEGYGFSYWTENDEVVSYNANYYFAVTGETHLTAHFALIEGNIVFADANVKAICVANWDTNGDGMLSYVEAASVTSLGEVFRSNTNITSFKELQYFTNLTSISDYAFSMCSGLTSIVIPNSVTSIGNSAFFFCSNLVGFLTIPNAVTSIGNNAFYYCSAITSLTIGNSVTSIGNSALYNCRGLTSLIVLAEAPPTLGSNAFKNVSTDIPVFVPCGSVETYQATGGWNSFSNILGMCSSGTITLAADPAIGGMVMGSGNYEGGTICTVNAIPNEGYDFAFWTKNGDVVSIDANYGFIVTGDSHLVAHFVTEGNIIFADANVKTICVANWDTDYDGELSYAEAAVILRIGESFRDKTTITSFDELQYFVGLTSVDNSAFYNCSSLTSIAIPSTVTSIGSSAFYNCSGLTCSLIIPNSVTSIGSSAFYGCSGFTGNLVIPNSVTSIGYSAFYGCSGFTGNLVIPNSVTSIGGRAFYGCRGFTSIIVFAETPPTLSDDVFHNWNITIPVYIPCGFEEAYFSIPWGGIFRNFVGMCGGTVTTIANPEEGGIVTGGGLYESGQTFTVTAMPAENYTFVNWTKNGMIVSTDAEYTFYVAGDMALVAHFASEDNIEFADANVKSICLVNWDTNGDGELSYAEAAAVTDLGDAFRDNTEITSFEELQYFISLTTIGNYAFYNCNGLNSLIIPNVVTKIGSYAFQNCSSLSGSLTLGNSLTEIGYSAFQNCSGFTGGLTIPNSVTSIGWYAFKDCSGFSGNLTIGNSVTGIGNSAFYNCTGFTSIVSLAETPPSLNSYVFYNWNKYIPVYVPCGFEEVYASIPWGGIFRNFVGMCGGMVTVTANPEEGGIVTGGGLYESGQTFTVTATPTSNYAFINWTKNGIIVSTDAEYTFYVAGDMALVAHFASEDNIEFADDIVKSICVSHWDTNDDGELSYAEAGMVTDLGSYFRNNSEITSFDELQYFIGLSTIGGQSFRYCSELNSIIIPNVVTTIGMSAFYNCSSLSGSLTIPNSVITINDYAFQNCSGLTGCLTIGNSVTEIGHSAFLNCSGFTGSLTIPNSVTSVGTYAFKDCSGFTGNLIIGNSVTEIGYHAFYGCSGFTGSLIIPNSVTSIRDLAFYNCSGFTGNLIIGNSNYWIGPNVFTGCNGLTSITIQAETPPMLYSSSFDGWSMSIPVYVPCGSVEAYQSAANWNQFTNIQEGRCDITVLSNIDEGGSTTGTGNYCLGSTCTITAIANGGYNFQYWTKNDSVVSDLQTYSFVVSESANYVAHFEAVVVENIVFADATVKAICVANWDTNGDGELSYDEAAAVTSLGQVFRGNTEITSFEELQFFTGLRSISDYAFYNCSGLTGSLIIPNSVTSIGSYAFNNCRGLTGSLIIPNNVTYVGTYAFYNCRNLGSLTLPNSLTAIWYGAFRCCAGLTGELFIPNAVTSIYDDAFDNCDGLTSLVISNSVVSIGNSAFYACSGLNSIVSFKETPPEMGSDVFSYVSTIIPVYVPCESVEAYQSAEGWNTFSNIVCITSGTVSVAADPIEGGEVTGTGMYEGGTICTVIATPNEGYHFANWTNNGRVVSYDANYSFVVASDNFLTAHFLMDGIIDFADSNAKAVCVANWDTNGDGELSYVEAASVKSFNAIFWHNTEITSFDELQYFIGLPTIGAYAFHGCSGLTRMPVFPSFVKSIDYMAFAECTSISGALIIPNSVTSISSYAFSDCSGFTGNLIIPNSVTTIGEGAFYGCSGLTGSLTIPNSMTIIDEDVFSRCSGLTGILTIPNSITSISNYAFFNCSGLKKMIVLAEIPPTVGSNAFYNISSNIPVYVPCESVEAYQSAEGWNAFSNIFGLCSSGTISVVADPIEGGEVLGTGTYEGGAFCTVTATPSEGYVFANWTENGEVVSYDSNYCFVVTGNCVLTAHFVTDGNIVFADANVKAICVANWDTNGDGELSYVEAASVMSLGEVFYDHTEITSFEELQYFIGLTNISHHAFFNCSGLTGNLLIPNTVTSIGESAFWGCSGLTGDLVIPNSVTTIGNWAFLNCSGFTGSLTIGNSVTTIGYMAFRNCSGFRGGLTIGNSMNLIDDNAFSGCSGFTGDLTIPNSVTSIGNDAFRGCSSFTGNLTIPNSVTSIGDDAFYGCSGLTGDLVIPNTVTEIGGYTFYGCSGFTGNLTIPNSVTIIGSGAFQGCSGFTGNLTIPNSVTSLGYRAFYGCSGLTGNLIIPNSVTSIGSSAFYGCSGLTGDLVISNSVTTIGDYAFQGCSGFTGNLTIPNSVTIIGGGAFQGCSGFIGDLTIPNSVSSIESNTFYNCRGFTGCLTIPNTITSIGSNAFRGCSGLTAMIVFAETPPTVGASAFYNISTNIPVYVPCESVETYQLAEGWNAFSNIMCILSGTISVVANPLEGGEVSGAGMYEGGTFCTVTATPNEGYIFVNWTKNDIIVSNSPSYSFVVTGESVLTAHFVTEGNIVFADANVKAICVANWDTNGDGELSYAEAASVMSLGEVFRGNTEITSFEELQYFIGLTAISNYAFSGCSGFTGNLFIPNSVTSIGNYAFYNCSGFTGSLTIPNAVTSIGNSAFRNCSGFVGSLTIPNAVASIDDYAFYQCSGLSGSLTIHSSVTSIGNYAFSGCCGLTGDLVIPNSVTSIGGWAFYGCSGFTGSLTIGNSVATIGNVAFYGCSGFGSLTIPNSVTTIGNSAFDGCSGLNAVYYTGDVNQWCSIQFAFSSSNPLYYAHNLYVDNDLVTDLLIPETVREILDYTFYGATCLTSLTIPNSVTSIGEWAFYGCSNLTGDLVIPNSVTTIDEFAFSSCRGLTGSLTIPNSVTSIGYAAFSDCSGFNGTLTLPDSIASISGCAFRFCSGLTGSLTIPNAVTSIGWAAFQGCSGLTGSLIIPYSVTSIETTAFYNCNSLESVTMLSPSVPTLGGTAFSGTNANYYIYVPYASLNDYKTATNWSNYESRIFPMAYVTVSGYGSGNDKWVFVASPLSEDVVPTTIDNMLFGTDYDLYRFDQSATDEEWQNYKVDSFNLVNGQGYVYANDVEVNVVFKGVFNEDETKVVSLEYDVEKTNPGWNLVGNPFPVDAYLDRPYYVMNEEGTAINPIAVPASTPIPPCVGVLVKANGPGESVTFSRSIPETLK